MIFPILGWKRENISPEICETNVIWSRNERVKDIPNFCDRSKTGDNPYYIWVKEGFVDI